MLAVRRPARSGPAIQLGPRTAVTIVLAAFLGFVAFFWPFAVSAASVPRGTVAPLLFGVLLLLVLAVLVAQLAEGGIDAKALAMLGVLAALDAALRPLGAGTAGIETVFFLLILAGRVFGPGFGFTLGCTSLFASAIITGGVGPWLPYQMFGSAFVGLAAGFLPRCRGRVEIALLAAYGAVSALAYGFLLNLSFWPYFTDQASTSYVPGAALGTNVAHYLLFDGTTSLGWDTGRAITNAVCILVLGPAILAALRRAHRRARFDAPGRFEAETTGEGQTIDSAPGSDLP